MDRIGSFVEIEVIDTTGSSKRDELLSKCEEYMKILGIKPEDLSRTSYSDRLLGFRQESSGNGE